MWIHNSLNYAISSLLLFKAVDYLLKKVKTDWIQTDHSFERCQKVSQEMEQQYIKEQKKGGGCTLLTSIQDTCEGNDGAGRK